MSPVLKVIALAVLVMGGVSPVWAAEKVPYVQPTTPPAYDYPIPNPYAATIIGTPPTMRMKYDNPKTPAERKLVAFPKRDVPEGFWYNDGLLYGEMLQDHPAPLVFVIGGTGSGHKSVYTLTLAQILYQGGNHVITLPSPTNTNFIVSASSNFFPGNAQVDAEDLYRVMNMIDFKLKKKGVAITTTGIAGYSLGAWHAAFVGYLDDQQHKMNFNKILLINPPLNLHNSIQHLDAMLLQGLPGGVDGLDIFLDQAMARLSSISNTDALDFRNENLLLDAYIKSPPSDASMATTIGLTFRFSAANMIMGADIMSHAGYIFPKDRPYKSTTPMNDYMAVALRTGLTDYYKDIYATYYKGKTPGITDDMLVQQTSLESLRDWIAGNQHIGLMTNKDDVILMPGEMNILEGLFAGKAWIFPTGGHLGNMAHPTFAWYVTNFMNGAR